ncbi:hypothetical protein [Prosthecobacter sp.]|uniref:hypothetical protein n=1 Tax=Prosthecobacter sp. TaxID=1965333 RepID=UPI002AB8EBFE|nr:hypothetical protein [Prosthecobacter sp.]MDZ4405906.1 hypothetical protein [Prosthecobacter sp.]
MQAPSTLQPPTGASPFQIGGNPLFKTAGNEPIAAPPINSAMGMSPFSIAGATPTNAPLTVGDVINQLPPEVVRAGALPLEQPLSLPPMLLENALRSGQAALPVFELYRVCPALFQVPISPQDPRLVPLPAAKLPGLIAQAREGQGAAEPAAPVPSSPSPFSFAQPASPPAPAASPFQIAPQAEPGATHAQAFPMSPFAAASPGFAAPEPAPAPSPFSIKPASETLAASPFAIKQDTPPPSPFTMQADAAPQPAGSPFSLGPNAGGSPFSMPQQAASPFSAAAPASPASASPFAAIPSAIPSPFTPAATNPAPAAPPASISSLFTPQSQERASTPAAMPAAVPAMPFGSPFAAAMKEAEPQAAPAQAPSAQPFAPSAAPAPMFGSTSSAAGMAKLGFAAVLNGYSVEELGFNPVMVPAWITTSVSASTLNEQISSGNVIVELGALIDGVSDLGFRNTLATAKRDFQVRLPQNEVFHALTSMASAPAASSPSPFGAAPQSAPANNAFTIQPGPPAGQVNRVETSPPASFAASAMPAFAPQQPPPNPLSAFATPAAEPPAQASPTSSFTPKFGAALNPFAQSQPPATPAPTSAFGSAQQPAPASPFTFNPPVAAEPAPPARPQVAPVSQSLFPPAAPEPTPSPPSQPLAGAFFQPFGNQPSPFASQPAPQPPSALAPTTKPFDPFAASASPTGSLASKAPAESGFNSAQLLGQSPAPQPAVAFSPAPEIKQAPNPFAAPAFAPFQPTPSFAPALDEIPSLSEPVKAPASRGLFSTQPASAPLFAEPAPQPRPESRPAPMPNPPAAAPAKMAAVKHSFLGLSPVDTQTDQLLLRALLGTEENLAAPRVVELLATQHGLSACVCLHGSHVLSHADTSKPDASEFQRQAPDIARQLRGLAPLIGIEGAETFTLNAGGRLLTFCFPGSTTVAVLHDVEPSNGLRDKITLIARELARLLG